MKTIKTVFSAGLCLALCLIHSCDFGKGVYLISPDGAYEFSYHLNQESNEVQYSLFYQGKEIIHVSRLGFVFSKEDGEQPAILLKEVTRKYVDSSWRPLYGERAEYPEAYSEVTIGLEEGGRNYSLHVRAYNEGMAFRIG